MVTRRCRRQGDHPLGQVIVLLSITPCPDDLGGILIGAVGLSNCYAELLTRDDGITNLVRFKMVEFRVQVRSDDGSVGARHLSEGAV